MAESMAPRLGNISAAHASLHNFRASLQDRRGGSCCGCANWVTVAWWWLHGFITHNSVTGLNIHFAIYGMIMTYYEYILDVHSVILRFDVIIVVFEMINEWSEDMTWEIPSEAASIKGQQSDLLGGDQGWLTRVDHMQNPQSCCWFVIPRLLHFVIMKKTG